ncbi:helix-turn-helix domain-containing protein [Paenibacillus brevis]|uniref:AraC family transcriptional regulator n=1 Tax=Paenibacillus brevis TaxID=2841508 RepID=A0ABS6FKJ6_9BACL|nr:helix-turn-helix domain-containing protein [Paenibacillus brevis]MBU5670702.1 AraC family transcriptional regulator [Paenibacillus brevis]
MRTTMNRLVRYKAFQKLTISYFLLILLTVSLLSSVLFYLFSRSAVKEIDRNSRAMLSQITYASDVVYNQVTTISDALLTQPEIISFLNDSKEDKTSNYHVFQQLSQFKSGYPYIYSIGIYRPSTKTTIDTAGLPFDSSLYAISAEKYMEFYPRGLIAPDRNQTPLQLLTFLLYPDFSFRTTDNPLIYINVEEQSILTTIRKISKADAANNVFVINNEGKVISHTDVNLFLEDLSDEKYVQHILDQDDAENSFTVNIHNKKHLITYVKSEEMDWYFVSVTPYSGLISNIDQLRNVTLLVTAGIVLAGLLISIFLTKNIYKPLSTLFEKIMPDTDSPIPTSPFIDEYKMMAEVFHSLEERERSMQFVINRSSLTLREHYLHSLLRSHPLDNSVPGELIQHIAEKVSGPYFCVLVFKIDQLKLTTGKGDADQQPLLRFALGNIAKEMLEHIGTCDYLITGENEAVVIMQYPKNELPEELKPALLNVQHFLNHYFKVTVSIGVGDVSFGRINVPSSYTSAQQYVKYRLIYGQESILDAQVIRPHMMTVLSYPSACEKKLIEAVQSGKPESIQVALEHFIEQISSGSINQVITYSIQLMLSLLKHFEYLQHVPDSNFNEYLDAINDIEVAENLTEIKDIFNRYCANIYMLIEEKNHWMNAQKHNIVIEKVQNYIQEHYAEPSLSLEMVSSIAGLSPSYLGKLFKNATQQSFSEYLNHVRLEQAKMLLASTQETAAKISESVGIYNISYFSTLFKKKYGLSPSAYREQVAMRSTDMRDNK